MNIKAFIFDMDGVMLDSEPLQLQSFNKALEKFNIKISMPDFKKNYMGFRDTQICEKIVEKFNLAITANNLVNKKRDAYLEIIKVGVPPTEGLIEAVKELSKILPLGIASSSQVSEIENITRGFGIRDFFKVIVSGHEVPNGKPEPDVYLKASMLMGVAPELCGVIEDTLTGIRSAKAAGMKCIAITTTHEANELNEADYIISSFSELLDTVKNL